MNSVPDFQVNTARDALALLSQMAYQRFGDEALPLIADVCYRLGITAGERIRQNSESCNVRDVGNILVEGTRGRERPAELLEASDNRVRVKGYTCPLKLENTSRKLCEAMMSLDRGMFEGATGKKINLTISRTVAAGDEYCDVVFASEELE